MTNTANGVEGSLPARRKDGLAVYDISVSVSLDRDTRMVYAIPKVASKGGDGNHGSIDLRIKAPEISALCTVAMTPG